MKNKTLMLKNLQQTPNFISELKNIDKFVVNYRLKKTRHISLMI